MNCFDYGSQKLLARHHIKLGPTLQTYFYIILRTRYLHYTLGQPRIVSDCGLHVQPKADCA